MPYSGWKISEKDREMLLGALPPLYPDVIAHHITLNMKAALPQEAAVVIIGYCNDDDGVECFVVEVNGTHIRPDGNIYHITWSIDRGRGKKPVDSNKAIAENGWTSLITPVRIDTIPFFVDKAGEEVFTEQLVSSEE